MSGDKTLTGARLRDAIVISLAAGAQVSAVVSVVAWILFFGSPVTIAELAVALLVKALLGFAIGSVAGLSLSMQFLMLSALSALMKRSERSQLASNITRHSALFGAIGGLIGGMVAGAISIP